MFCGAGQPILRLFGIGIDTAAFTVANTEFIFCLRVALLSCREEPIGCGGRIFVTTPSLKIAISNLTLSNGFAA